MIDHLIALDKDIFLFLNGLHSSWLDPLMFWISGKKEWIPFYITIVGYIIYEYRWKSVLIIVGIILSILLSDQITSGFMKPFFERLRPSHEPSISGLVHHVNDYRGGKYGFASSHAANAFGLAMFIWLLFRKKSKWWMVIFLWATVVAYSRIYLGVHYPGDIIVGAVIGILSAFLMFKFVQWVGKKYLNLSLT